MLRSGLERRRLLVVDDGHRGVGLRSWNIAAKALADHTATLSLHRDRSLVQISHDELFDLISFIVFLVVLHTAIDTTLIAIAHFLKVDRCTLAALARYLQSYKAVFVRAALFTDDWRTVKLLIKRRPMPHAKHTIQVFLTVWLDGHAALVKALA